MSSKTFIKKIKEKLLAQRTELEDMVVRPTDIDTDGDETDEIQGNLIIDLQNRLNTRNQEKLFKIDAALKRIDENTYGVCQDCEDDIPEKRLLANPYFLTCVTCAEEREAENKQKRNSKS